MSLQHLYYFLFLTIFYLLIKIKTTHSNPSEDVNIKFQYDTRFSIQNIFRLALHELEFHKLLSKNVRRLPWQPVGSECFDFTSAARSFILTYNEEVLRVFRSPLSPKNNLRINFATALNDPLVVFQMLRRMTKDIPKIYFLRDSNKGTKYNVSLPVPSTWPTLKDFEDYAHRLVKLVEFYKLRPYAFAKSMYNRKLGVKLSPYHTVDLGFSALENGRMATAVEFMSLSWESINENPKIPNSTRTIFENGLIYFLHKHDYAWRKRETNTRTSVYDSVTGKMNIFLPLRPYYTLHQNHDHSLAQEYLTVWNPNHEINLSEEVAVQGYSRLKRLCLGDNLQNSASTKQLTCWITLNGLMPYRMELFGVNPDVVIIYNFLSRTECVQTIRYALLNITSEQEDKAEKLQMRALNRRIQHRYEGLTTGEVPVFLDDKIDVKSFVPGQLFTTDSENPTPTNIGEASLMIYLNRPIQGGRTIFFHQGISLKPDAGTAINYVKYSSKKAKSRNYIECPVVYGQKWMTSSVLQRFQL